MPSQSVDIVTAIESYTWPIEAIIGRIAGSSGSLNTPILKA